MGRIAVSRGSGSNEHNISIDFLIKTFLGRGISAHFKFRIIDIEFRSTSPTIARSADMNLIKGWGKLRDEVKGEGGLKNRFRNFRMSSLWTLKPQIREVTKFEKLEERFITQARFFLMDSKVWSLRLKVKVGKMLRTWRKSSNHEDLS